MSRRPSRARKHESMPGWVGLTVGLTIGLFVAFLVYLELRPVDDLAAGREERTARAQDPEPAAGPKFDFYTILPELEVFIPEPEPTPADPKAPPSPVEKPGTYVLQAGSFESPQEADRLKAQLALIGVEAGIQTVTVDNRRWHRVRVGPFDNLGDLNDIRARLREHDIQVMLLKVKS